MSFFMLFVFVCVYWCQTRLDYTSYDGKCLNKRQDLLTLHECPRFTHGFWCTRVAHLFSFLCCVVCLRAVSCVPNVASVLCT